MTVVDDIRAIQAMYPEVNVNLTVQADFVTVTVQPLPPKLFPPRDTNDYPVGTYVVQDDSFKGAHLTSFRYADKDVDAAVAAALAVIQGGVS